MNTEALRAFYDGESLDVNARVVAPGAYTVEHLPITLHAPDAYDDPGLTERYLANLEQLDHSCRIVEYEGRTFEIAELNPDMKDHGTRVIISTYTSSLTKNTGNRQETAGEATVNPDRHIVYLASPGNGGSSYYDRQEKKRWKTTGRLTYEEDGITRPFPIVAASAQYLKTLEVQSVELSGDSQGAIMATAVGIALREAEVDVGGLFLNGRPGLCDTKRLSFIGGMLLRELKAGTALRELGLDAHGVTPASIDIAKQRTPAINARAEFDGRVCRKTIAHQLIDLQAMLHGPSSKSNPALEDTTAFLRRQPGANLMVVASTDDPQYSVASQEADFDNFMQKIAPENRDRDGKLTMSTLDGLPHAFHTHLPVLYHGLKDYVFRHHRT